MEELGNAIGSAKKLAHAFRQGQRCGRVERRQLHSLSRPIFHVHRVKDPDIGLARVGPPALVKTASGFFAEPSACEHFLHERRKSELRASSRRQPHGEVVCDVHENVEAGDVDGTKCGALRPADRGACYLIDLLDRVHCRRRAPQKCGRGHAWRHDWR